MKLNWIITALFTISSISFVFGQAFVWPGDVNDNGITNFVDAQLIGSAFGISGPPRSFSDQGSEWSEKLIDELWGIELPNGIDASFADCNGDGVIDYFDFFIVHENFGLTHPPVMDDSFETGEPGSDPSVQFDTSFFQFPFFEGSFGLVPITIGTDDVPLEDFQSISLRIFYDENIINPENIFFDFSDEFLENTVWNFSETVVGDGEINIVVTSVLPTIPFSPFSGAFGAVSFIIEEDVIGNGEVEHLTTLGIDRLKFYNSNFDDVPMNADTVNLTIQTFTTDIDPIEKEAFKISPNPAMDRLSLKGIPSNEIEYIEVINNLGIRTRIKELEGINNSEASLTISGLEAGLYYLQIQLKSGTSQLKKFIKL